MRHPNVVAITVAAKALFEASTDKSGHTWETLTDKQRHQWKIKASVSVQENS